MLRGWSYIDSLAAVYDIHSHINHIHCIIAAGMSTTNIVGGEGALECRQKICHCSLQYGA